MRILTLLLTSLLLITMTTNISYAQKDNATKAKRILDQVSKKYGNVKSLQADFTLKIKNSDAGIEETQSGKVYIKGDMYKIETDAIGRVSDNKSVWTHFKEDDEVQITEFDPDEGELTPAQFFTIYDKDFDYALNDEIKEDGVEYAMIDLTPTDKNRPYYKVRLTVDKEKSLVTKGVVFERNGTRITYELLNFDTNTKLKDSFFTFEKNNADIEVIDLR